MSIRRRCWSQQLQRRLLCMQNQAHLHRRKHHPPVLNLARLRRQKRHPQAQRLIVKHDADVLVIEKNEVAVAHVEPASHAVDC